MDLTLKRRLFKISNQFKKGDFNLGTISTLLEELSFSLGGLNTDEVKLLLEIPISVLKVDADLKDKSHWCEKNKEYFAGNLCLHKEDEFVLSLRKNILKGDYSINDMWHSLEYVKDNYDELIDKHGTNIELILRSPNVTIRDDCKLVNEDQFISSGELFAKYVDKAINL